MADQVYRCGQSSRPAGQQTGQDIYKSKKKRKEREFKKKGPKKITTEGVWGAREKYSMALLLLFDPLIHSF